jgi:hypothetical protein
MSERPTALSQFAVSENEFSAPSCPPGTAGVPLARPVREGERAGRPPARDSLRADGAVAVVSRQQLQKSRHWPRAFAVQHKDRRYL